MTLKNCKECNDEFLSVDGEEFCDFCNNSGDIRSDFINGTEFDNE